MHNRKTLTTAAGVFSGHVVSISAALAMIAGAVWWLAEPRIVAWVHHHVGEAITTGGPCARIPPTGHFIAGAAPGAWGDIEWRGVVRLREDCGVPSVTGVLTNGGGFYHDAPLSISGIPLPAGVHTLRYRFLISPQAHAGPARFQVVVTYPNAVGGAPPAISPWLAFQILPQEDI